MPTFVVGKCPSDSLAITNRVICPPDAFSPDVKHIQIRGDAGTPFAFSVQADSKMSAATLGFSGLQRKWAELSLKESLDVQPFRPPTDIVIGTLAIEVDFLKKSTASNERFDTDKMAETFQETFMNQVFTQGQMFVFNFSTEKKKYNLSATVKFIHALDQSALTGGDKKRPEKNLVTGFFISQSNLVFSAPEEGALMLSGKSREQAPRSNIINPDFDMQELGIGGLDKQFSTMFRRAFASRVLPPEFIEKLGLQHVRGMLLYGPPGTGKTLMARQIGKMLQAREPKIVNGPEILNKYVGESEANIRALFADAEEEQKKRGDNSGLHIIIFDEIDAICKTRGTASGGTGVADSVVNQLLSKIDGVDSLNNILLIGMTNRKDMIDEALLRPGRLELQIPIELADEAGRLQILEIHTKKMRDNGMLDSDVDLPYLASQTKNFSGAEIAGLVRNAISFATNRCIKTESGASIDTDAVENMKVGASDFSHALDEASPAFGVSTDEFQDCCQNGIVDWGPSVQRILSDGELFVQQVRNSSRTPLVSVLLHGSAGSGKTALASKIALGSDYPFIKLITAESMVGFSEQARCQKINTVFEAAYKTPVACIVVDDIERLMEYVPIGPRFMNSVLQCLMVLLKKKPKDGRKLLVIATTSCRRVLADMGMLDVFSASLHIDNITKGEEVLEVLKASQIFNPEEFAILKRNLSHGNKLHFLEGQEEYVHISVGVKKLYMLAEMANQEKSGKAEKFLYSLYETCQLGKEL